MRIRILGRSVKRRVKEEVDFDVKLAITSLDFFHFVCYLTGSVTLGFSLPEHMFSHL